MMRSHRGIMPVIKDQIATPPVGIMPVMQVIEAQRASILVPHDHLHNNHVRTPAPYRSGMTPCPQLRTFTQSAAMYKHAARLAIALGLTFSLDLVQRGCR